MLVVHILEDPLLWINEMGLNLFIEVMITLLNWRSVDVFVTLECIHLWILCIVTQCLFQDVFVMYLSHVIPRGSYREFL